MAAVEPNPYVPEDVEGWTCQLPPAQEAAETPADAPVEA